MVSEPLRASRLYRTGSLRACLAPSYNLERTRCLPSINMGVAWTGCRAAVPCNFIKWPRFSFERVGCPMTWCFFQVEASRWCEWENWTTYKELQSNNSYKVRASCTVACAFYLCSYRLLPLLSRIQKNT